MDEVAESLPDEVGDPVEEFLDDNALPKHQPRPERAPENIGLDDETIEFFDDPVPESDDPAHETPLRVDE